MIVPESAPFSPAQRAWLSGFLTGIVGGSPPPAMEAPNAAVPKKAEPTPPPNSAIYDRLNPFPAPILEIRPLTRKDSQKDVRFVSFGLRGSGLEYQAGDALGVFPENDGELADEILQELEATGYEPTITPENFVVPARLCKSNKISIIRLFVKVY